MRILLGLLALHKARHPKLCRFLPFRNCQELRTHVCEPAFWSRGSSPCDFCWGAPAYIQSLPFQIWPLCSSVSVAGAVTHREHPRAGQRHGSCRLDAQAGFTAWQVRGSRQPAAGRQSKNQTGGDEPDSNPWECSVWFPMAQVVCSC